MAYKDQISALFNNAPVTIQKLSLESFMSKTSEEGMYYVYVNKEIVAGFKLVCMPGCCGIVVSTGAFVFNNYRRKGLGTLLNRMRQQMAWDLGYTVMACTDLNNNTPQQRILFHMNWDKIWQFVNRRTGNRINVHMIDLEDTGVALGFDPRTIARG